MNSNLKTLFFLKKPKAQKPGPMYVYMRITVDFQPTELSTGCSCLPKIEISKPKELKKMMRSIKN
jgi:hypothetical protein